MHLQTSDDLWARIEVLVRELPGGVIATDGDGTLWGGDVGEDLFHAFLDHGHTEPPALDAFRQTARDHDLSDAGTGLEIARRIYAAYLGGGYPEERMCELMTWCFAGWTRKEMRSFARAVVDGGNLASRLHGEVHAVLEQARAAGVEAFLVSASPIAVVLEAGARVGFSEAQVVAAVPVYEGPGDDDRMLANVERPIPYGPGKVHRLRERIGESRLLYASFGDNAFDVALLGAARVAAAVRPKPRLRARAAEVTGLVELAPPPATPPIAPVLAPLPLVSPDGEAH
ncbi:MAG TPA: haloacid dehalogenase-like hydrolase [Polyangiaceae bacterium]|nr:haloacid dehalogenase-like hydrolase [Polyangiaceae bacterium]